MIQQNTKTLIFHTDLTPEANVMVNIIEFLTMKLVEETITDNRMCGRCK